MIDGECFGETSLFSKNPERFCVVTALKPTHLLVIDSLAFKAMNRVYDQRMEADCMQALRQNEQTGLFSGTIRKKMVKNFEKLPP
jgi:CRP-like cAMP-binding protein